MLLVIVILSLAVHSAAQSCQVNNVTKAGGEKWTDAFWQFECKGGSFKIIGCISSKSAGGEIIPVNANKVIGQIWRNCTQNGTLYKYQEGIECKSGNRYRSGHFELQCVPGKGRVIAGCLYRESNKGKWKSLAIGDSVVEGNRNHSCYRDDKRPERVHYANQASGCKHEDTLKKFGETWTDDNFEFTCVRDQGTVVLACMGPNGTKISLNTNVTVSGILHRCQQIQGITLYQQNSIRPCRFTLGAFDIQCRNSTRVHRQ